MTHVTRGSGTCASNHLVSSRWTRSRIWLYPDQAIGRWYFDCARHDQAHRSSLELDSTPVPFCGSFARCASPDLLHSISRSCGPGRLRRLCCRSSATWIQGTALYTPAVRDCCVPRLASTRQRARERLDTGGSGPRSHWARTRLSNPRRITVGFRLLQAGQPLSRRVHRAPVHVLIKKSVCRDQMQTWPSRTYGQFPSAVPFRRAGGRAVPSAEFQAPILYSLAALSGAAPLAPPGAGLAFSIDVPTHRNMSNRQRAAFAVAGSADVS